MFNVCVLPYHNIDQIPVTVIKDPIRANFLPQMEPNPTPKSTVGRVDKEASHHIKMCFRAAGTTHSNSIEYTRLRTTFHGFTSSCFGILTVRFVIDKSHSHDRIMIES